MNVQNLSHKQKEQLRSIIPSNSDTLEYFPCCVKLINGDKVDNVYIVNVDIYLKVWGVMPDEDKGKKYVLIEDVEQILESPNRLPVNIANKLYEEGESGMGYCLFKIIFDNGETIDIVSGNAIDFVPIPVGLTNKNIKDVLPHVGSRQKHLNGLDYYWCLYKE